MVRFLLWCDMEFVGVFFFFFFDGLCFVFADVCGDLRSGSTYVVNYSCQFWIVIVLVCGLVLVD